ncbi:MAG: uroporphyrinogen decarboxylase family protein [Candidatus Dehalobacter alkaniphilus]
MASKEQIEMVKNIIGKRDKGQKLQHIERIILTVFQEHADRIPTGFLFTEWIVNRYGYSCSEAAADPEKHSDAIVKFFEEFDYDVVFPGIETTVVEAEILGCTLKRPKDSNPQIVKEAITCERDVEELEEKVAALDGRTEGRMPVRLELFKQLVKKTKGEYAVIATPMQPLPVAIQILGYPLAVKWMKTKPLLMHRVVEACTQAAIKFAQAFKETGIHGITSIAAWNSVPNFRPEQLWEFDTPYLARMIQSASPLPFMHYYWGLHLLGDDWTRFLARQASTGTYIMTNLDPDPQQGPSRDLKTFRELANTFHKAYAVGVHTELFKEGTPEIIENRVKEYIKGLYPCKGGCMVVPCAIPQGSPVENVRAFIDALNKYGTFPINLNKLD